MSGPVLLHAAVPAAEASRANPRGLGLRQVVSGSLAAIVGPARRESPTRAALRHARVVADALESCSAVVPFRLGDAIGSADEVEALLDENRTELVAGLAALFGRVEMGLKVRIPAIPHLDPERLDGALRRIRSLAPEARHRIERRRPVTGGEVLEGSYLVPRSAVEPFWAAADALRTGLDLRVLGSGPWAPYSFCELSLRPARAGARSRPPADRRPS